MLGAVTHDATLIGHISLAALLGFVVGWERHLRGRPAGERTFAIICVGAAAFTDVGAAFPGETGRIIAGIATGIGFIGAGLVLRGQGTNQVHGLTTAAGLWTMVAVGVLCGAGLLLVASFVSLLVLFLFEMPYIPGIRLIDPRRFQRLVRHDEDGPYRPHDRLTRTE
jgi:putative Mg2+ transporter-C (MgtC) family protein